MVKRLLSGILILSLLFTTAIGPSAQAAGPVVASAVSLLTPPSRLGALTASSLTGSRLPEVILIQDLHVNYGGQKNISGLLEFLSQRLKGGNGETENRRNGDQLFSPSPRFSVSPFLPFTVAVEGASGSRDSSI